jgi:hypothetical protein
VFSLLSTHTSRTTIYRGPDTLLRKTIPQGTRSARRRYHLNGLRSVVHLPQTDRRRSRFATSTAAANQAHMSYMSARQRGRVSRLQALSAMASATRTRGVPSSSSPVAVVGRRIACENHPDICTYRRRRSVISMTDIIARRARLLRQTEKSIMSLCTLPGTWRVAGVVWGLARPMR